MSVDVKFKLDSGDCVTFVFDNSDVDEEKCMISIENDMNEILYTEMTNKEVNQLCSILNKLVNDDKERGEV